MRNYEFFANLMKSIVHFSDLCFLYFGRILVHAVFQVSGVFFPLFFLRRLIFGVICSFASRYSSGIVYGRNMYKQQHILVKSCEM